MNTNLLKGKIIEKGLSMKEFSAKTGIKKWHFYRKTKSYSFFLSIKNIKLNIVLTRWDLIQISVPR